MEKIDCLYKILKKHEKICIAYSGGTDSDFLLNVAAKVLDKNVVCIIANGVQLAKKDYDEAVSLAKKSGVMYYTIDVDVFETDEFKHNRKDRCYHCKKNIMSGIIKKADELGFGVVADGKNCDDAGVYRPGAAAAEELGVVSPLYEAGFTKSDIRNAAKKMGLETWNKASNSCLATRFPYDTLLTAENFSKVEKAEHAIYESGIYGARVRLHGDIARIEVKTEDFGVFMKNTELIKKIKEIGFRYITLDLEGFRSGSMD